MVKKLIIIAHQDDESIWAYNILDEDAHVVVVNSEVVGDPKITDVRNLEFIEVSKICKFTYEILGFPNNIGMWDKSLRDKIGAKILEIYKSEYEVYTHNKYGEYGNIDHIQLHYLVVSIIENIHVFMPTFDYKSVSEPLNISESITMSPRLMNILKRKKYLVCDRKRILLGCYKSQDTSRYIDIKVDIS